MASQNLRQRQPGAIVYVDDDAVGREVFKSAFGERYWIQVCTDGEEALEYLDQNPVAVVVTDQRMPNLTGNELCEIIKQRFHRVVRIVVTAHSDLDLILEAVNDGLVARYLLKPWSIDELDEALRWGLEVYASVDRDPALRARLLNVERLATLGGLLAGVLHDIGGPVSYLTGNSERLSQFAPSIQALRNLIENHADELDLVDQENLSMLCEEFDELVTDMRDGCEHLVEVCRGLRPLVRHDAPAGHGRADADKAVRYVASVARHRAKELVGEDIVEVLLDAPDRLPVVATAFPALVQVLNNLLDNAIEAIQRANRMGTVTLRVRNLEKIVEFQVHDDADGIPDGLLPRVTDPFFTTRANGTGLGLAQCRRLVETAGGHFLIESSEGQGTTATFSFAKVPKALLAGH